MEELKPSHRPATLQRLELDFFDPVALAETVTDAEIEIEQRKPGPFHARISSLRLPNTELVTGTMNQAYRLRGTYPSHTSLFSFWFPGTAPMTTRGINFDPADTLVFGQDGAETELYDRENTRYGTFAMDRSTFLELAESTFELDPEVIRAEVLVLPRCGALLAPLRRKIREFGALAKQSPERVLELGTAGQFEKTLIFGFLNILSLKSTAERREMTLTVKHRKQILGNADDFINKHCGDKIGLIDLCQAVGTSKRALQYAFQEGYDMSPMTFLRTHRLNRAHRDLLEGSPDSTSVTKVAFRYGCSHLGRFAAEYHRHFNERPSDTLRRRRNGHMGLQSIRMV